MSEPRSRPPLPAPPALREGVTVDGYRVGGRLGAGGMGEVWEARDLRLGRRVALKVVRPEKADPLAIARFLEEARLTARATHPNIVTVYAAGEFEGQPYVALELLDGDSLRRRLGRPLPFAEALRVAHDIARAVEAGHAAGVVHGDLKPENVVLPTDGRPRVVDFGLARLVGAAGGSAGGTPEYLAPELWSGGAPSPAADVWALGVTMWELFAGDRPWRLADDALGALPALRRDVTSPDPPPAPPATLPADLAELLTATLAKDPAGRPTAAAVASRLARRVRGGAEGDPTASPYRGLLPFHEEDARWFFGREQEVARVVERLRDVAILPVVGPSGAGKSSFVRAGVVPRLREQGPCTVVHVRPGAAPLRALASALAALALPTWITTGGTPLHGRATPAPASRATMSDLSTLDDLAGEAPGDGPVPALPDLESRLLGAPGELHERLLELAAVTGRVVLVVDQLEEVFTHGADDVARDAFLGAVFGAFDDPREPVRVLVTVRDDFLGRLAHHLPAERVPREFFVLHTLDPAALERALADAAAAAGARADDPALWRDLVADLAGSPAALPLAQFAARQLWDRRDVERGLVRRADLAAAGGAAGLLARHADDVLAGLPPAGLALARELLLALVTADGTRRVVRESEVRGRLGAVAGRVPLEARRVLERLAASRLVVVEGEGEGATYLLAHESLVATWPQLARWLAEAREGVRHGQELEDAARLWDQRGRREAEVWQGDALRDLERAMPGRVSPLAAAFLATARDVRDRATRRSRWLRALGALGVCGVVAGSLAVAAGVEGRRREAREAADRAIAAQADALAASARAAWERGEGVAARAQLRAAAELGAPAAARELAWQLGRGGVEAVPLPEGALSLAVAPDGRTLARVDGAGEATVLDLETGAARHRSEEAGWEAVGWSGREALLAASGRAARWVPGGATTALPPPGSSPIGVLKAGERWVVYGYDDEENGVLDVYEPDGSHRTLVAPYLHLRLDARPDGTVVSAPIRGGELLSWDLATGRATSLGEVPREDRCGLVIALPGGDVLTLGSVARRHRPGREPLTGPGTPEDPVFGTPAGDGALVVDEAGRVWAGWGPGEPSPRRVASLAEGDAGWTALMKGSRGGDALVVHHETRAYRLQVPALREAPGRGGHAGPVAAVAVGPDGRAWSAGFDHQAYAWDAADLTRPLGPMAEHSASITRLALSPDGGTLLTGGDDALVGVWDAARPGLRERWLGHQRDVVAVGFVGGAPVTVDLQGRVSRWTLPADGVPASASGFATGRFAYHAAFEGDRVWLAGEDGAVSAYALDGRPGPSARAHDGPVAWVAFGPDGTRWTVGYDAVARAWPADGGAPVTLDEDAVVTGPIVPLADGRAVWPSADGLRIAAADGSGSRRLRFDAVPTALAAEGDRLWVGTVRGEVRALRLGDESEVGAVGAAAGGLGFGDGRVVGPGGPRPPEGALEAALAASWRAVRASDGDWCVLARGGAVERRAPDGAARWREGGPAREVGAAGARCVWLADGEARLRGREGAAAGIGPATRLLSADGEVALPGEDLLVLVGAEGTRSLPAAEVTAFTRAEGRALAATTGGVLAETPEGGWRRLALEATPDAPVARVLPAGPWLAAGFFDGTVGLWEPGSGRRVWTARMAGAAAFAERVGDELVFLSDLGARLAVPLPDGAEPCAWRSALLRALPVTWRDGAVVPAGAEPPAGCGPEAVPGP